LGVDSARWEAWARKLYPDPGVAGAAANAAAVASAEGAGRAASEVRGHQAAVAAGGEYRCRADNTIKAIGIAVSCFVWFGGTGLAGFLGQPSFIGFAFLAAAVAIPILAIWFLIGVHRNSSFLVTKTEIRKHNWRGKLSYSNRRSNLGPDDVPPETLVSDEWQNADDPESYSWWSTKRIDELAAVLGARPRRIWD